MTSLILKNPRPFWLISLVTGPILGILVVCDPYLTNYIASFVPLYSNGSSILKLYPFMLTSILLLISYFFLIITTAKISSIDIEKLFIILFLVLYQTISFHQLGPIDGSDAVLGIFLMIFLMQRFLIDKKISIPLVIILSLPVFFFALISAANGGPSSIVGTFSLIKGIVLSFLIANVIINRETLRFFVKWLIIITTISAVIAIFQEFIFIITGVIVKGFFMEEKGLKYLFEETSFGTFLRVFAFNTSYKHFTFFLISALLILFNIYIYKKEKSFGFKVQSFVSFFLMSAALVLTFSKDGIMALALGIILSLIIRWPFLILHGFAIMCLIFLVVYFTGLIDIFYDYIYAEIHWGEPRIRLQMNREGIYGFLNQHPWLGVGVGKSFKYTAQVDMWPPHNNIIVTADEIGIFGLITYVLLMTYVLIKLFSLNLMVSQDPDKGILRGILFTVIAVLFNLQFHGLYFLSLLWMYLGIMAVFDNILKQSHV